MGWAGVAWKPCPHPPESLGRGIAAQTGALAEQPRGELALTVPATRARNAQISPNEIVQKLASLHANVQTRFNSQRHLVERQTYKTARSAALAKWQNLMA